MSKVYLDMLGQCLEIISTDTGLISSLFLVGLFGGVTHCSMMCGPFVLAQTQAQDHPSDKGSVLQKVVGSSLWHYHLGRMTTYIGLAALTSSIINIAFIASELRSLITAIMLGLAGFFFLISALRGLSDIFPWAAQMRIPYISQMALRLAGDIRHRDTNWQNYIMGVLLGFMPCAMVFSALMAVSSTGNILTAVVAMGAFTLGTIPALWGVAFVGKQTSAINPQLKQYFSQGAMVLSALMLFILAGKSLV